MDSSVSGGGIIAPVATKSSSTEFALPDRSWDEGRLLDYMRQHDKAIAGLERSTLQHEYCFGAAAQLKYEQLGGRWTQWAKDQGYPKETFRRRRLLFVRAGSMEAISKHPGKMEAYYELGIYRRPTQDDLDALDSVREAKTQVGGAEQSVRDQAQEYNAPEQVRDAGQGQTEGDEADETLEGQTSPIKREDDPTASEILGKVGSLILEAERVGLDESCLAQLDDLAATINRLRDAVSQKAVAA